MDVALVTGLSGAGLGTAAKVLEDLGWYVADNMPPELITRMIEIGRTSDPGIERLALVVDVRSRLFNGDVGTLLADLAADGVRPRVLFLDASDDVLIRRFESVRRSHPLQNYGVDGTLTEGISDERARLATVKEAADIVIDTSSLSVHGLRDRVAAAFGDDVVGTVAVTVESFGFKYGVPLDADVLCDMRFLPNPHWIPELRPLTGKDAGVRDYVLGQPDAEEYLELYHRLLNMTLAGYRREGKRYMTVAVGCTGGKHRSVAMTEALAERLRADADTSVRVVHRDLGRE
ncbi:RNase adapter RapZ [Rhodococcus sp. BP-349]|nr:RNase adapter RapZ [Rhodococcus sp. BP-363]MBY6544808.1 RNase adapter RapZ [Rhodococcus sp. BP-369]MBY6564038.1 RNase adapter RapZ [Rhodococcus sp. BP-370]MBY6579025.1 RNase adapter RapZ [Rhodococcus sp. BP-364]MBY6588326.1 RNase adapter RapZ [Rhodococcus sp. BP-358]MBY6592663.1 RNase adapter RapZ [Rhodococcus sp. BP-362]MBY6596305.1 RNase adapter RapZ [Rhodococcus sp. BP-359]MBY6600644.1 RNase adapter RapZ [Rhodococcus sp. BP-353]MBY6605676.1 RNase adapter RapZ [Rhodococcus sp. BP-351]